MRLPGKGLIESAKGKLPGLIKQVHRLRLKTSFFSKIEIFEVPGFSEQGLRPFQGRKNTKPAHFSRAVAWGFATALQERRFSFSVPKTLFRKRVQW